MDSSISHERERLAALRPALTVRAQAVCAARRFFEARGYLEVQTPVRIPAPALELHIDAEPAGDEFLRTSPELHMKRLIAAGYERIFQIGPCFRRGERGALHQPEFTMLEWYCAHSDYMDILRETRELIVFIAAETLGCSRINFGGAGIELDCDWNVVPVADAFSALAGWDPAASYDADRFDFDLVEKVEPALPMERPSVLRDYPAAAAALARLKPDDPRVAERWEL
jgi:lysyl-tRNA synthetase class 2